VTKLPWCRGVSRVLAAFAGLSFVACGSAFGQLIGQDTTVEVHDLPSLVSTSHDRSKVLLTSLDTIVHDKAICCGRDSALVDAAQAADPNSLKDIASKLDGRHLMGDGRPIKVTTEYMTPDQVRAGHLIALVEQQHAALMMWNDHLYVVHGVVYIWAMSGSGETAAEVPVIHKILLWDTRFSDSHREVVFDRETGDVSKVQGLMFVQWAPQ
jgi:hypothetical protein